MTYAMLSETLKGVASRIFSRSPMECHLLKYWPFPIKLNGIECYIKWREAWIIVGRYLWGADRSRKTERKEI